MRKLICTLIMLSMIGTVQAKTIECIGISKYSLKTWKVIGEIKTGQFIINGDVLKAVSTTNKNADPYIVYTENFVTEAGTYVYDGIGFFKNGEWFFLQRNAVTNELTGYVSLSCSINK